MPICLEFKPSRRLSALPVAPLLGLPSWLVRLRSLSFFRCPVCQELPSGSPLAGPSVSGQLWLGQCSTVAVTRSQWAGWLVRPEYGTVRLEGTGGGVRMCFWSSGLG